jgi:hypothetical protein
MNPTIYLHNGIILLDTYPRTYSQSLTIKGGLVVEIDGLPPDACQRIDLDGAFAMPGLIDSHLHLVQGSSSMGDCNLSDVTSKEQFASLLLEQSAQIESGQWLLGFGWTQETLGSVPDATWFPNECDLPMLCYRVDYHCAVLNEAALAVLPCDAIAKLTGGSQIANGIVKEDALYEGVGPHIPSMPAMYKQRKTQQTLQNMYEKGITAIGTMEDLQDVEDVLAKLPQQQRMRICVMLLDPPSTDVLRRIQQLQEPLHILGFKAFLDGSLGSRTAKMYSDWEDANGDGLWAGLAANDTLLAWAKKVESVGFAPAMHAIGDAAVGKALEVVQSLDDNCFARIEHAQCIADKDLQRLSGKMFGVQPLHQPADAKIALEALGSNRLNQLHNWRRMLDAGARLSFGSDWPVAEADPIAAMRVAVGCGLTVDEVIFASTKEAANSLQLANSGSLRMGSNGDVVVLDSNPYEIDWNLAKPSVTMTILAGNIVFEKSTTA